ncbi:MAG: phage baseplate assembly protein V [Devosia sp.]
MSQQGYEADRLAAKIAKLEATIEQLDRRVNNMFREARVIDTDHPKGLVKVEAAGLVSDWQPWLEVAGGILKWDPPVNNQRVIQINPTGEPGQGMILAGGFSNHFKQPSQSGDESVYVRGDSSMTIRDDSILFHTGVFQVTAQQVDFIKG